MLFVPSLCRGMRNRVVVILVLPIVIFLWLIGWSLFWMGSQTQLSEIEDVVEEDEMNRAIALYEECSAHLRNLSRS